jgi:transcription elongation factor Elf1
MLADLACPACGHVESRELPERIAMNRMRIFCDCCGAFVTILLNDEQVEAIRGNSVA